MEIEMLPVIRFRDNNGTEFFARTQGDYYRVLRDLGELRPIPPEAERYLDTLRFDAEDFDRRFNDLWEPEYKEEPVDYETFVTNPYFLGASMSLFPRLIEEGIKIFHSGREYAEIIYTGGIGWGKSYHAVSIVAYDLYRMLCMKSPQRMLGLADNGDLYFVNLGITEGQAKSVFFSKARNNIIASPYFLEQFDKIGFNPKNNRSIIALPNFLFLQPGSSRDTSIIGQDVVGVLIDETNWLAYSDRSATEKITDADGDHMTSLYHSAENRLKSRLAQSGISPGHLILISSALHPGDWIENHIERCQDDPKTYIMDKATWESRPEQYVGGWFRVQVGNDLISSKVLNEGEKADPTCEELEVPEEFRKQFERDPDRGCREFGGKRTISQTFWLRDRTCLLRAYERAAMRMIQDKPFPLRHPANEESTSLGVLFEMDWDYLCEKGEDGYRPRRFPSQLRWIHIDLAKTRDAASISMGYVTHVEVVEKETIPGRPFRIRLPIIEIELMLQIVPGRSREILISPIRELILNIKNHGFKVRVSADQYQSVEILQDLQAQRVKAENLSIHNSASPWMILKDALMEDRLSLYRHPVAHRELIHLMYDKTKEIVDHPAYDAENDRGRIGSKDVADTICGVV
ncbi:MAG TPA: hypothetical protein PK395_21830, partial [bacterium]|nr:hypothetical protein [bacterium]